MSGLPAVIAFADDIAAQASPKTPYSVPLRSYFGAVHPHVPQSLLPTDLLIIL